MRHARVEGWGGARGQEEAGERGANHKQQDDKRDAAVSSKKSKEKKSVRVVIVQSE